MTNKLAALGMGGAAFTALCCFTPLLPIMLTTLGLSGLIAYVYNDVVLLITLLMFTFITGYALWRRKKST